ncbi:hypothetical protein [Hwanghaeella sp.]|uniref:hypothetical protein n=1 Tax=Hwanghaeella sp. TaxID=2605943 RepID=UPI003CCC2B07
MIKLICHINAVTISLAFFMLMAFVAFVLLSPFLSQHLPAEFVASPETIALAIASIIFFTVFIGGFAAVLRCAQLLEIIERRTRSIGSSVSHSGESDIDTIRTREKLAARSKPQLKPH